MYEPLDSAAGHVRLLILEPARKLEAPLQCSLIHASLSEEPDYEALSYTWGTKGLGGSIVVSGTPVDVFENLEAALRRLRLSKKSRRLWIDAICINQADVAERQQQVPLMQRIYEQARQVCIWLGESSEASELGMAYLGKQSEQWLASRVKSWTERQKLDNKSYRPNVRALAMMKDSASFLSMSATQEEQSLGEVRELMVRPWWSRVWVLQEAVLAKNIVTMCGSETTPWDSFGKTVEKIQHGSSWIAGGLESFMLFGVPFGTTYKFPDENYRAISSLREAWHSGDRNMSLLGVAFMFRFLECTDPRDRIYSFLGFASSDLGSLIRPHYASPVSVVYEDFARLTIETTRCLDILNCKREWLELDGKGPLAKAANVYSTLDQGKYYDDLSWVIDKPDGKPRQDWARLPPGWERIVVSKKSRYYYNHLEKSTSQESPLDTLPPQPSEHFSQRRVCPVGWSKTWDNLGRARVSYAPKKSAKPKVDNGLKEELARMPSWIPSWATYTNKDPKWLIAMLAQDGRDHWFTANHDACIAEGGKDGRTTPRKALVLEGLFFDEIEHLGTPWHPGDASPPISSGRMAVFSEWRSLAQAAYFGELTSPYSLHDTEFVKALGQTLLIDPLGEELEVAEGGKLFQVWMDGTRWDTLEVPQFHAISLGDLMRKVIAFSVLEERMGEYYMKIVCADESDGDGPSSQNFEASKAAKFSMLDDFNSVMSNTGDGKDAKWSYRTHLSNMAKQGEYQGDVEKEVLNCYGRMILRIQECCENRAFFVTRRGYFGLAPWNARPGDKVYGLKGGKTPYLLREASSGEPESFNLVGEVFVHDPLRGLPVGRAGGDSTWNDVRLV
ncbi:uncharacterized protein JN550_009693 [Neoarthrinium moseri]|uniref:uncharacterized protein n=1 Tax=Neoarthrinium moseri TaxID=1658444 RepID=UPI001FDCA585|nr:uncharacterized protein JN550_009693 [Neoarthrinium moseri]KAI1863373.1 hypothetical protein JN550_009693 [Neoarthrinium moseri]